LLERVGTFALPIGIGAVGGFYAADQGIRWLPEMVGAVLVLCVFALLRGLSYLSACPLPDDPPSVDRSRPSGGVSRSTNLFRQPGEHRREPSERLLVPDNRNGRSGTCSPRTSPPASPEAPFLRGMVDAVESDRRFRAPSGGHRRFGDPDFIRVFP
jgi:hypothetical protein